MGTIVNINVNIFAVGYFILFRPNIFIVFMLSIFISISYRIIEKCQMDTEIIKILELYRFNTNYRRNLSFFQVIVY